ncbi:MAG: hypothetical protein R3A11_05975 [Bdellovibrionota bacterium]
MKSHPLFALHIVVLAFLLSSCSQGYQFGLSALQNIALNLNDPDGVAEALDVDNDGIADGIDTDDDGIIDIDFEGNEVESNDDSATSGNSGNNSNPSDLRDGNCLVKGNTLILHSKSITITDTLLSGFSNVWIVSKGSNQTFNLNLTSANLGRVIVTLTGNSNTLVHSKGTISDGICVDKINGDSNRLTISSDVTVSKVDLSVGGGENSVNVKATPSSGISYSLSGKDDCLSITPSTTVLSSSLQSGNSIKNDGSFCF